EYKEGALGDLLVGVVCFHRSDRMRQGGAVVGAFGRHVHQDGLAVKALPPERVSREQIDHAPRHLGGEEVLDTATEEEAGQAAGETEVVRQPGGICTYAELVTDELPA